MHWKQLMHYKPAYEDGQLLLADDFIREQKYHAQALYRQNLDLHGVGVVRGLEVARASDISISVSHGVAIDGRGRQIVLQKDEVLELTGGQPSTRMVVTLGYRTERQDKNSEHGREIGCYAFLRVSSGIQEGDIVLATVRFDDHGRLAADAVSLDERSALRRVLAPESVTLDSLDKSLRIGWLRMPFRPTSFPQDQADAQPPFRVGPTETVTHKEIDGKPNTNGAAGTMAILLPPQASCIHQLRIAGSANDNGIKVELFRGGWDEANMKHVAVSIIKDTISGAPYDKTFQIPQEHVEFDREYSTLSIALRSVGFAKISLVAIQISY